MMTGAIVAAAGGFFGYLMLVLVALRTFNAAPAVIAIISAFAAYLAMVAVVAVTYPPFRFWPSSVTYWFLVICFLMVFGAIYKSISLRILAELVVCPGRQEIYEIILGRYVKSESFRDRVQILVVDGLANKKDGKLMLTPKGRRIAGAVVMLQRLFRIERSG